MARTVLKGFAVVFIVLAVISAIWLYILIAPLAPRTVSAFTSEVPRDEVASLELSNYPCFGPDFDRNTTDSAIIDRAYDLMEHATFTKWDAYGIQRVIDTFRSQVVGGYWSAITLYDADGTELASLSYDPGALHGTLPGDGVVVYRDGCAYVMDGDQTGFIAFLDDCVSELLCSSIEER